LDESLLWGSNDAELLACKELYNNIKGKQGGLMFTPPSLNRSIMFPGPNGGINFYGCTINPEKGNFICPVSNWGNIVTLLPQNEEYPTWCENWTYNPMSDTPYKFCMTEFKSGVNNDLFCNQPPWKFLVSINIITGEVLWKVPLGWSLNNNYQKEWGDAYQDGGLIMTGSDLIFVSGTSDKMLHIFDATNGNLLSSKVLPDQGNTPITYKIGNTQYICVVSVPGIEITTFALPSNNNNNNNNDWHTIAIVGGIVAGLIIIVSFAFLIYLVRKRNRSREEEVLLA